MIKNRYPRFSDWSDPGFVAALKEVAGNTTTSRVFDRQSWLKARILQRIDEEGWISPDSTGLVDAAGNDPLIPKLATRARTVLALDRYDQRWSGQTPRSGESISGVAFAKGDARYLPLRSCKFDWAICSGPSVNYFGGVSGARAGVAELGRVLKPGAHALVDLEMEVRLPNSSKAADWLGRARPMALLRQFFNIVSDQLHQRVVFQHAQLSTLFDAKGGLAVDGPMELSLGDLPGFPPARYTFQYPRATANRPNLLLADLNLIPTVVPDRLYTILLLGLRKEDGAFRRSNAW